MGPEQRVVLWTRQEPRVLECLQQGKRYQVKRAYVDAKYREVGWSFQVAYGFFIRAMQQRLAPLPGDESPVWLHGSKAGAGLFEQGPLLKLAVPVTACVFMDGQKWNRILNLEYLGTSKEASSAFQKKLDQQGLTHASLVFKTPYYPQLKQEILRSWQSVFEVQQLPPGRLQAAVWHVEPEWLQQVE